MKLLLQFALISTITALPNHATTPGAINAAVTQENIASTICRRGWTRTIRPPETYTRAVKIEMLRGRADHNLRHYELDHLISLELGGHPRDRRNLWPQRWTGACNAHHKDELENTLNRLVCSGKLTLAQAQREIAQDWVASYKTRVNHEGC